jgi:hypothetical protein
MKRTIRLSAAAALALAAAGCGTEVIDGSKVEHAIRAKVAGPPFNLSVASVKCPSNHPVNVGSTFQCTMTLTNGESEAFNVLIRNKKGDLHYMLAQEVATWVQNGIDMGLAARGIKVTSSCPRHVPVVTGSTFNCSLRFASGQHATAVVTIVNQTGGWRIASVHQG